MRVAESEPPPLEAGQALLSVERFGLTANNVTYAVFGDAMSYWSFFPADDGWGRVPVWGFAESADVGRVYGYLPPSSHLVVRPEHVSDTGFVDASPHRAELPAAYNRYQATATDPFYSAGTEPLQMLLRPLFITSFLIDDLLADEGLAERGPVVLSSASSKTAIAAAYLLSRRADAEVVGLTSEANAQFVEGLGIYARTVPYEAVADEGGGPATFVDMAGDAGVRRAVHDAHGDNLLASVVVGATHHDAASNGGGEPPPAGDVTPPKVGFVADARPKLRKALKKGLHFTVVCDEGCSAVVALRKRGGAATKLGSGKGDKLAAGQFGVTAHFSKKARKKYAKAKSLKLSAVLAVKDAAGNSAAPRTLKITLKRR